MVRQGHLPRHGPLAAADQAHIGDGVVGGSEGARGDDGGAVAGQAGDARDAGGLQRCRPAHRRQEGDEASRQPRLPCPGGAEEQDVMDRTPASPSPLRPPRRGMEVYRPTAQHSAMRLSGFSSLVSPLLVLSLPFEPQATRPPRRASIKDIPQ
jgi:hypothetical protein